MLNITNIGSFRKENVYKKNIHFWKADHLAVEGCRKQANLNTVRQN